MRKLIPFLVTISIVIVGAVLVFTYEVPEFKIFLYNQNLDQKIVSSELQTDRLKEHILNDLQPAVNELILQGQTYDQNSDLTNLFTTFNEMDQHLREYVEVVIPQMNEIIETANFVGIEKSIYSLLEDDQTLAQELLSSQRERLDYLLELNNQIKDLAVLLLNFEDLFYTFDRPSQPILYFQNLTSLFEEIAANHTQFVTSTEAYHRAKTDYYLILSNMSFKEYFLGR